MKVNRPTVIMSAVILGLGFLLITHPILQTDQNTLEVFFGVFGVIYAIVAGFIIVVLLENYRAIKGHIWAEVNALQDLRDYLIYVDNQQHVVGEIKGTIKMYVESIITQEWPDMVNCRKINMDTPTTIYAIMQGINRIDVTNSSDAVALSKLIDTLGEITTHRTNRLYASGEKLPFLLMLFIVILSILVVFAFTLLPIEDMTIRILLNGINMFAVVFSYIVIQDLSHPFQGAWCINSEPYQDLLKTM